jgi:hypothetical protein
MRRVMPKRSIWRVMQFDTLRLAHLKNTFLYAGRTQGRNRDLSETEVVLTVPALQQRRGVFAAASRRVTVHRRGRRAAPPWPVIAGENPEVTFLGGPRPGSSTGAVVSSAPARLIEGGLPTEQLVARIVVAKYAALRTYRKQAPHLTPV